MPKWFHYSGYGVMVVIGLAILHALWGLCRNRRHWHEPAYMLVGYMWGVGLGFKVLEVGPEIFRYWLADIGFPVLIGWGLWDVLRGRHYSAARKEVTSHSQRLALSEAKAIGRRHALVAAVVVSYMYEIVSGTLVSIAKRNAPPGTRLYVGGFDWLDILAYTIGGVIGWVILTRWLRFMQGYRNEVVKWDESEARARTRNRSAARTDAERGRRTRKKKKR